MLQRSRKTGKAWKFWKLKTPVYCGEGGKTPPFCPTLVPTFVASTLLGKFEKAALRRFMCPQLFCVLWAVEIAEVAFHAGLVSCADCWDATAEDVDWPKRALRNRLAIHFACCVTSTSIRCFVLSGFRFRHRFLTFITKTPHTSKNKWDTRRLSEKSPVLILARVTSIFDKSCIFENSCARLYSFLVQRWWRYVEIKRQKFTGWIFEFDVGFLFPWTYYYLGTGAVRLLIKSLINRL